MAIYPQGPDERRIQVGSLLLSTVESIFIGAGMIEKDAGLVADTLVYADRRGNHSHGMLHLPDYVNKLHRRGVDPRGEPKLVKSVGPVLKVDVGNAMGQIGMAFAIERAIERAGEIGVAFAAVGGSNHCGALNYYSATAASRGMIGFSGTNSIPTMAPHGGLDRIVGLNPISTCDLLETLDIFCSIRRSARQPTEKSASMGRKITRFPKAGCSTPPGSRRPIRRRRSKGSYGRLAVTRA